MRAMRRVRHLGRANKGMAMAMTAVMLPVLVIIMAFAIDIGLAQTAQSRLESAVNQAADAGARRLPDTVGARDAAQSVARLALADAQTFGSVPQVGVAVEADSVRVEARMTARAFFGRFAGKQGYDLSAQARRRLGP